MEDCSDFSFTLEKLVMVWGAFTGTEVGGGTIFREMLMISSMSQTISSPSRSFMVDFDFDIMLLETL